jgi:hypothetical protein
MAHACLACGFPLDSGEDRCPKCDASQRAARAGECLHGDVAHRGQTIAQARQAAERLLSRAAIEGQGQVRLVVGGGAIRAELLRWLEELRRSGRIRRVLPEPRNPGAILVELPR